MDHLLLKKCSLFGVLFLPESNVKKKKNTKSIITHNIVILTYTFFNVSLKVKFQLLS